MVHRRMEVRRALHHPVEIIAPGWDEPVTLVADDLSPSGAYIESDLLPEPGEHVVCSFHLGGPKRGTSYSFFGQVKRINWTRRVTDVRPAGFGIEFVDASPKERIAIRSALRGTPPPRPGLVRDADDPIVVEWLI